MLLLVDDDLTFQTALSRVLAIEGYEIECASNGAEAWDWLTRCPMLPELILLDLDMPILDGWQFLAMRAKDPRLAKIPVVIISGSERDDERGRLVGAAAMLAKPFRIEALLDLVEEFGPATNRSRKLTRAIRHARGPRDTGSSALRSSTRPDEHSPDPMCIIDPP